MPVNMGEGILKVKVMERGHCRKSFFHWFYNCLRLKNGLNQL